jgi:phage host-nuclease inhibitor protein Gam
MARKQSLVSVPTNLSELNARIALVGSLTRDLEVARAAEEEAVAKIKAASAVVLAPLAERIAREMSGIEKFATANRTSLLAEGMKSVSLSAGRIGWRMTPLRVSFMKKGAEKALAFLKANRMKKYLRVITEINKEALLADQPVVDGVSYKQQDEFFVEPNAEPTRVEAIGEAIMVSK